MRRFDMNQAFTREEIDHWLVYKKQPGKDQVVWSYVAEDPETHKITDFVSFYNLESTVIDNPKHDAVHAAYLYYYATETAFSDNKQAFKERLQLLMNDALICAKNVCWNLLFLILYANLVSFLFVLGPFRCLQCSHLPRQPPLPRGPQVRCR